MKAVNAFLASFLSTKFHTSNKNQYQVLLIVPIAYTLLLRLKTYPRAGRVTSIRHAELGNTIVVTEFAKVLANCIHLKLILPYSSL